MEPREDWPLKTRDSKAASLSNTDLSDFFSYDSPPYFYIDAFYLLVSSRYLGQRGMGAAPSTKRRLPRRRDTRGTQLAAADKAVAAANKLSNEDFTSEFIKPRYDLYNFFVVCLHESQGNNDKCQRLKHVFE